MITLSIGLVMTSKAMEQICQFVPILCPQGGGSNVLICGDTTEDIVCQYYEMYDMICNN